MKPWMIWLLDPKPPLWRSCVFWIAMVLITTALLGLDRGHVEYARNVVIVLLVGLLAVRTGFRMRLEKDIRGLRVGLCPGCGYDSTGTRSKRCTECSLRLDRERVLLRALHAYGYNGLASVEKRERKGEWSG